MAKQQTAQTTKTSDSTLAAILSAQAEAVDQQLQDLLAPPPIFYSKPEPGAPKQGGEAQGDEEEGLREAEVLKRRIDALIIAELQARATRLQQVQQLLSDDPELLHVVDASIRNRVSAAARRQSLLSVAVAIISLIVGWLLSAISPLSAAHLLAR